MTPINHREIPRHALASTLASALIITICIGSAGCATPVVKVSADTIQNFQLYTKEEALVIARNYLTDLKAGCTDADSAKVVSVNEEGITLERFKHGNFDVNVSNVTGTWPQMVMHYTTTYDKERLPPLTVRFEEVRAISYSDTPYSRMQWDGPPRRIISVRWGDAKRPKSYAGFASYPPYRGCCESSCNPYWGSRMRPKLRGIALTLTS